MEILKFKDIEDLYSFMCAISQGEEKNITAVLNYDDAVELMRCFLDDVIVEVGHLEIGEYDYNGYDKEYYVSIDTDLILDVCPAMPHYNKEFGYVPVQEADIILYGGDVKQSIVSINDAKESFQIEIDDEDDELLIECSGQCPLCSEGFIQRLIEMIKNS